MWWEKDAAMNMFFKNLQLALTSNYELMKTIKILNQQERLI